MYNCDIFILRYRPKYICHGLEGTWLGSAVVRIKAISSFAAEQTSFHLSLESTFTQKGIYKDFKRRFDAKCHGKVNPTKTTILYFKTLIGL